MSTSTPNKTLFRATTCISYSRMEQYIGNKLSALEKHELENHLLDCELCSKAADGFFLVSIPGNEILELNKRIDSFTYTKPVWFGSKLILFAAMAAIVISGVTIIIQKQLKNNFVKTIASGKNSNKQKTGIEKTNDNLIVIKNPEIAKFLSEETKSVKPAEKNPFSKNTFVQATKSKSEIKIGFTEKIQTSVSSKSEATNEFQKPHSGADEIFIENLKVSDYNKYYTIEEKYFPPSSPLIEPRFANKNDMMLDVKNDLKERKNLFTADKILRRALQSFNSKEYSMCIPLLDLLIQNNEEDVNALFYSALSFENINKPDKAIIYLDKILLSKNKSFHEEAKWHKALSLMKINEKESAKIILKEISEENGFYSEQAKEKMKEL